MTSHQREILSLAVLRGGKITKQEAVDLIGRNYYCNAPFHVGNVLSRMVNARLLVRVKRGVYEIAKPEHATIITEPNLFTL